MPILLFTAIVLVGRIIFATVGVLASGQGLKVAVQSGFSLAQIGEFSFIIATLGMQLGVLNGVIYPIIVAVSVITTFTTPYLIKLAGPVDLWIEKMTPQRWGGLIKGYSSFRKPLVADNERESDWKKVLRFEFRNSSVYFVLALAVAVLARIYLNPFIANLIAGFWGSTVIATITLLAMAPMMAAIIRRKEDIPEMTRLWNDSYSNRFWLIMINLYRVGLCFALAIMVLIPLFPRMTGLIILVSKTFTLLLFFYQGFGRQAKRLEARFFENIGAKGEEHAAEDAGDHHSH
jgi:CPA2 family monovalent cation:H+ antiporter-2